MNVIVKQSLTTKLKEKENENLTNSLFTLPVVKKLMDHKRKNVSLQLYLRNIVI